MRLFLESNGFALPGRFRRKGTVRTLSLSSAMSRPIVATLTAHRPVFHKSPISRFDNSGAGVLPSDRGLSNDNRCADIAPFSRLSL